MMIQNRGIKHGSVVQSLAGHDTGKVYLVIDIQCPFIWLTDGKVRHMEKLKKKRIRHVKLLGHLQQDNWLQELTVMNDHGRKNAYVRKLIESFIEMNRLKEER